MNFLFLHIGLGKTGTSAIQSFLAINRSKLLEDSIYYPFSEKDVAAVDYKPTGGNGLELAQMLMNSNLTEDVCLSFISQLFRDAEKFSNSLKVCLSAEKLANPNVTKKSLSLLKNVCSKLSIEIRVICYLRNVFDHAWATYEQQVKRTGRTNMFDDFIDSYGYPFDVIGNYSAIFQTNIMFFSYEHVCLVEKNGLIGHFLGLISSDIFLGPDDLRIVNKSLSPECIDLKRLINLCVDNLEFAKIIGSEMSEFFRPFTDKMWVREDLYNVIQQRHYAQLQDVEDHELVRLGRLSMHTDYRWVIDSILLDQTAFKESVNQVVADIEHSSLSGVLSRPRFSIVKQSILDLSTTWKSDVLSGNSLTCIASIY
ncbi:hypothetical protein DO97_15675 [Neosynechococcus sphagnicola sy1]|uniref:Sulfotransferase domain-containing protein n=1 Tax=Neosynechococcus sphagnicola sy1 TaxID=1497020 RepID=A0A098TGP9_9CYAN|nr:hypothetical protein [Neosynechococcus sphagnicola]KGF71775.1 hypothetical protein DO97_15675 [Neosynechococcus sphagnicola sy1]